MKGHIIARFSLPKTWLVKNGKEKKELMHTDNSVMTGRKGDRWRWKRARGDRKIKIKLNKKDNKKGVVCNAFLGLIKSISSSL